MAASDSSDIRVYTSLASNDKDRSFLSSNYDHPGNHWASIFCLYNLPSTINLSVHGSGSSTAHERPWLQTLKTVCSVTGSDVFLRYGNLVETFTSEFHKQPEYIARSPGTLFCRPLNAFSHT